MSLSTSAMSMLPSSSSLCSNPNQCTAFHELSAHMSEMNTKLTSVLSLTQMFFHSWRTENLKQQRTQADILRSVVETQKTQARILGQQQTVVSAVAGHGIGYPTGPGLVSPRSRGPPNVVARLPKPTGMITTVPGTSVAEHSSFVMPQALPVEKDLNPPPATQDGGGGNGMIQIGSPTASVALSAVASAFESPKADSISGIKAEVVMDDFDDEGLVSDVGIHDEEDGEEDIPATSPKEQPASSGRYSTRGNPHNARRFSIQTVSIHFLRKPKWTFDCREIACRKWKIRKV